MNNSLYIARNRETDQGINELIEKYGLTLQYGGKKEQVFSGKAMLISRERGYTFLRLFSGYDTLMPEIKRSLQLY